MLRGLPCSACSMASLPCMLVCCVPHCISRIVYFPYSVPLGDHNCGNCNTALFETVGDSVLLCGACTRYRVRLQYICWLADDCSSGAQWIDNALVLHLLELCCVVCFGYGGS